MTRKNHSIGLKFFIFLLVAMMLFSAIGVMVIYLNVPTATHTTATIPSDPTPIAIPPTAPTTGNDVAPVSGEAVIDQEVPLGDPTDLISPREEVQTPTEPSIPTEGITGEPTPTAPAQ